MHDTDSWITLQYNFPSKPKEDNVSNMKKTDIIKAMINTGYSDNEISAQLKTHPEAKEAVIMANARVKYLLNSFDLWGPDNCFTFPDGVTYRKTEIQPN